MTFVRVRQARVPTGKAASRTIRKRSHSLANVRTALSAGDDTSQFAHELHSSSRNAEDRQRLMDEIRHMGGKFLFQVSAESSVAMKADLNIPWNKMRAMRRYTEKSYRFTSP